MKYVCQNCNFRFDSDENVARKRCPYCNKIESIPEQTAEDLIGEGS